MRRAVIVAVRTMVVLLFVGAAADVQIPGRSTRRFRIHLIDRSASVTRVEGPPQSLKASDADDIVAHDQETRSRGDTVTWASFGRDFAFESKRVDPSGTDLEGALATALARNPTELVLYTDGRADPGSSLFLCRERRVPVHVLPIGPTSVKDARIVRIDAPADAPPDQPVPISVVVESTYDLKTRLRVGADSRPIELAAHVPYRADFKLPAPDRFVVAIEAQDACPDNNRSEGEVIPRHERRKVLVLSQGAVPLPEFEVTTAASLPANLFAFDAVVLDNVALPPEPLLRLATWVRQGGGLVLLGGPRSYAKGDWKGTLLEELSPFTLKPDLRIAAVFGIDASGSMTPVFEDAVRVLEDARAAFDPDDDVMGLAFGDNSDIKPLEALRKVHPTGGTDIAKGITAAREHLELRRAGRRVIVLVTDGQTVEKEANILAAEQLLKDIQLIVVTTDKDVPGPQVKNVRIRDWNALRGKLREVVEGIQDLTRQQPGQVEFRDHPLTRGIGSWTLGPINRVTPKPGTLVLATAGRPPAQDPVLGLGAAGAGQVAAFTVGGGPALRPLLERAIEQVAGQGGGGLTLWIDPPYVRARGEWPEAQFETSSLPRVRLTQVGAHAWEGRLPEGLSGTIQVRKGRARAAATIPCPPELEALGIDRAAVERIAQETGGRVLGSPQELDGLPRPDVPAPRSGRGLFLVLALVGVLVEMGVSTFWKP